MRLVAGTILFVVFAASAFSQTCERKLTLGFSFPPFPYSTNAQDYKATLDRQPINVLKAVPFTGSRVLIILQGDFTHTVTYKKDFERMIDHLMSIGSIPQNVTVAYGVYAEKIAFSGAFTSNPEELRKGLQELASKATSGELGKLGAPAYGPYSHFDEVVDYFREPRPGDTIFAIVDQQFDRIRKDLPGNIPYTEGLAHLLKAGIHLDLLLPPAPCCSDREHPLFFVAQGTGGFVSPLNTQRNKDSEGKNWLSAISLFMLMTSHGIVLTVEVPQSAKGEGFDAWKLDISADKRSRIGIPPNQKFKSGYPDLLLCDSSSIASTYRQ
ncbi:MAG TPA: hypothetical protein VIB39_04330 [Candidatus Angelobacter sp.]|jgi:hypothetical protein